MRIGCMTVKKERSEYPDRRESDSASHLRCGCGLRFWSESGLAETSKRLGRKAVKQVAQGAKPDTILAWYRRLITQKFDGSSIVVIPDVRGSHRKSRR